MNLRAENSLSNCEYVLGCVAYIDICEYVLECVVYIDICEYVLEYVVYIDSTPFCGIQLKYCIFCLLQLSDDVPVDRKVM